MEVTSSLQAEATLLPEVGQRDVACMSKKDVVADMSSGGNSGGTGGGGAGADGELIKNGDFETWTDDKTPAMWTKAEATTKETSTKHGGSFAAKVVATSSIGSRCRSSTR